MAPTLKRAIRLETSYVLAQQLTASSGQLPDTQVMESLGCDAAKLYLERIFKEDIDNYVMQLNILGGLNYHTLRNNNIVKISQDDGLPILFNWNFKFKIGNLNSFCQFGQINEDGLPSGIARCIDDQGCLTEGEYLNGEKHGWILKLKMG